MKAILLCIFFLALPVSSNDLKYDMNVTIEFNGLTFKKAAAIEEILREKFPDAKIVISLSSEKKEQSQGITLPGNYFFIPDYWNNLQLDSTFIVK